MLLLNQEGFCYHPKCLDLKITHLCFADDLFIFANATLQAINEVKNVLDQFYTLPGMKTKHAK